jgi:hypothetical protein
MYMLYVLHIKKTGSCTIFEREKCSVTLLTVYNYKNKFYIFHFMHYMYIKM